MSDVASSVSAGDVMAILRAHAPELRASGIARLSLVGSVACGEAGPDSDVDLAAEFDPAAKIGLFQVVALERRISGCWDARWICCRNRWRWRACRHGSIRTGSVPSRHATEGQGA